jgi:DNA polymerase-1
MHPVVELIFEHRELVKLKTTYVDALPALVAPDGRIHTSYSQTIAQTGRLSSNNPNLQNIPIRTELGREIRKAFVAPKGRVFVAADYSQIELRVAAALSKDPDMIKAFEAGIDIHAQTAAELYGVPLEKVTKAMRYNVKAVNFGVLYGMGAHGLAEGTGMEHKQAQEFIKRYYELRPKLREYVDGIKKFAREKEYVETLLGRRRPCGEINSNNYIVANAAERMAVNVPIQGTAADIMKLAMVALAQHPTFSVIARNEVTKQSLDSARDRSRSPRSARDDEPKARLLLQIHDELIAECDEKDAKDVARVMKDTMENVYDLGVPIEVETAIGRNWGELK